MDLNFDRQIGQNVRRLRKLRGLTQDQLAARMQVQGCDVTRSALAKMEAGQRYFYSDELYCLKESCNAISTSCSGRSSPEGWRISVKGRGRRPGSGFLHGKAAAGVRLPPVFFGENHRPPQRAHMALTHTAVSAAQSRPDTAKPSTSAPHR